MLKRIFRISIFVLFSAQFSWAQLASADQRIVDKKFASLSFRKVLDEGSKVIDRIKAQDTHAKAALLQKMAKAAYYTHDFKTAETHYKSLFELVNMSAETDELILQYAHVLAALGKNEEAASMWQKYSNLNKGDAVTADFATLHRNLAPLTRNQDSYKVGFLPINSGLSEFSPVKWESGLVFVASRADNSAVKRVFEWDESPFLDLYFLENESDLAKVASPEAGVVKSSRLGSDYYTSATPNDGLKLGYNAATLNSEQAALAAGKFDSKLNSVYHDGPCDFFNDNQSIIFTRNGVRGLDYSASDGINRVHLYIADHVDGDWKNLRAFPYNSGEYSTGHPAFMAGENIMFFVSDMPGGFGGTDIYYSKYKDGKWHFPVNAGSKINTKGNEMFPFIDEMNNLYFASDGHPGLGGLDIFTTSLSMNGSPEFEVANLGSPLNSGWDDFGLIADASFKKGYFSSNRKNGGSDDDIYVFERTGEKFGCKEIEIAVNDAGDSSPMAGLEFVWYKVDEPENKNRGTLDEEGRARLCLPAESEFYFEFNNLDYDAPRKYLSTKGLHDFKPTAFEVNLKKIVKRIDAPVYKNSKLMSRFKDNFSDDIYAGTILGPNNSPLEGVLVRFINKCDNEILEQRTGKDGHYSFERDLGCDYEFVAIRSGFSTNYEFVSKITNGGSKRIVRSSPLPKFKEPEEEDESVARTTFSAPVAKSTYKAPEVTTYSAPVEASKPAVVASSSSKASAKVSFFDPKYFKVGDVIRMENIYYNDLETSISALAKNDLNQVVEALEEYPDMVIDVISHTDSRGDAKDNLRISQKRADEIKQYLVSKGISVARIRAIGMGESSPVNSCVDGVKCTDAEYRRNRRTEFRILRIQRL